MRALLNLTAALLRCALAFFRSRNEQAIVELALRQQLATYAQKQTRPALSPLDRAFWVALFRFWPRWKDTLVIVKPDTVVRWHRKGFRLYWRSISKRGPGRPPISEELKALIRRLASENNWRARKIHAEIKKLGFTVGLATVSRYLPKRTPDPGKQQRWMTFLRNHQHGITAMDFFVVPTVGFRFLYVWFIMEHRSGAALLPQSLRLRRRDGGSSISMSLATRRRSGLFNSSVRPFLKNQPRVT